MVFIKLPIKKSILLKKLNHCNKLKVYKGQPMLHHMINPQELLLAAQNNLRKQGDIEIIAQTSYRENKSTAFFPSFNTLSLICYKENDTFAIAKSNNEKVEKISLSEFKEIVANSSIFNQDFYTKASAACVENKTIKIYKKNQF